MRKILLQLLWKLLFHRCGDSTGWDQVDPEPALCQGLKTFVEMDWEGWKTAEQLGFVL